MSPALRPITAFGVLIALLLAASLVAMLWSDRDGRLQSAQRQSLALATGGERLLRAELATLERALRGVASHGREYRRQSPEQASSLLATSLRVLLERHGDIAAVTVVDDDGAPLSGGRGDPTLRHWTLPQHRVLTGELYVGGLEAVPDGGLVLRTAVPLQPGEWLLARLHLALFERVVGSLDTGDRGLVSVASRHGQLLAHSLDPAAMERSLARPPHLPLASLLADSGGDGIRRVAALNAPRDYPLVVFAGLPYDEIMASWRTHLAVAIGIYLLYLGGFAYLFHNVHRGARRQARLAEALRTGAAELALAHRVGKVGTWSIDGEGRLLNWSALTRRMLALPLRQASLQVFYDHVHAQDRAALQAQVAGALDTGRAVSALFRLRLHDGSHRWLSVQGDRVRRRTPQPRVTGVVTDITERVRSQARVQQAERQFRLVFDRNPAPVWIFDAATLRFLEVNQAAIERYGYSRGEFLAMGLPDIRPQDSHEEILRTLEDVRHGRDASARVHMHRRRDGRRFEVVAHLAWLEFDGRASGLLLAEDVSQRLAYERDLAWRASHHPGTGLLMVQALAERLDSRADPYTVIHVQLRGLQLVTDTLGREAGEEVLQAVVARLGALGLRYGLLAYQPAEDFVLAVTATHEAERALRAVRDTVSEPVRGRDSFHQLEPRIGVAVCPDDGSRADQVLGHAAKAAHAARENGVVVLRFDQALARRHAERLQLAGRIHLAIERNEFELHFQPIRHAASGAPALLEALLRWPQPGGGYIPPADFIQLCEDTGQIIALGRWVIQAAARAGQVLAANGWAGLPVAVNVSAMQLFNTDLAGDFVRAAAACGLPPGALQMELTESSLMRNPAQAMQVLERMNANGFAVALDDFGTGFSSMSYLQHLPLDALKIDRAFVADVERNPRNAAICRALLSLGHGMGLVVVAEGVETQGQLDWLVAHGCDQVQGYLLGRPRPLAELLASLGPA
ncbi:bifunctional diguanylate cyclase/phosphodiesterase [Stenotrophomonas mori]|uniref:EAL domain-containing protein n=1 Tax=Stenotrophomonas mori TaxID=2871096 RepID=A0ABT0SK22_9GAMM|nr:EAL domain-containing protein [Stenotrophomonas mori]MCL7715310.1 EAL domain-containing protein [Stenotrophomonas mori]